MNVKIYDVWGSNFLEFVNEVKNDIPDLIIMNYIFEGYNSYADSDIDIEFYNFTNKHNIPVKILSVVPDTNDRSSFQNVEFIYWETFWFYRTFKLWNHKHHNEFNLTKGVDINDLYQFNDQELNIPFICLNNRYKFHRCTVLDMLAKYNLIEKGAVSWLGKLYNAQIADDTYHYKYWDPKILVLDQTPDEKFSQETMPIEFNSSFVQLVTETLDYVNFITEKTTTPILLNKLFLVAGGVGQHKKLYDLGFKLYEELFDYSFDTEQDIEVRYDKLIQNINRYISSDYTKLYKSVFPKVVENKRLAIEYAKVIPKNVLHIYNTLIKNNPDYDGQLNILRN